MALLNQEKQERIKIEDEFKKYKKEQEALNEFNATKIRILTEDLNRKNNVEDKVWVKI